MGPEGAELGSQEGVSPLALESGLLREGVRRVRADRDQAGLGIRATQSSMEPLELTLRTDVTIDQQRKGICL